MITPLIPVETPEGTLYVEPSVLNGNGAAIVSAGAGAAAASIATGGATAAALTAIGVSAQAVPVVGQVLGAIALVAGFVAKARAKAKAFKAESKNVDAANIELIKQNAELDGYLRVGQNEVNKIESELLKLGVKTQPLNGFGDWLKKTFAPGKYQEDIYNDKVKENTRLAALVEDKTNMLATMQTQLQNLYDTLTGAKTKRIVLYTGAGIGVLAALYLLNKKFNWI